MGIRNSMDVLDGLWPKAVDAEAPFELTGSKYDPLTIKNSEEVESNADLKPIVKCYLAKK